MNKNNWVFQQVELIESNVCLENPGRGWYGIYTFVVQDSINPEELRWSLRDGELLALVLLVCSGICNIRYSSSRGCLSEAGEKCMIPDICHQSVSIECGTVCGSIWEMRYILLYVLRRSGEL